jgi:hypothetical protein
MIRQLAGAALALIAAWLLWQGVHGVQVIVSRGSPLGDALLNPPTSLWRIVAASLAVAGGALAAMKLPGGAFAGMTGAVLFAALGGLMAAMGTDISMWQDEAVTGAVLVVLAGIIVFTKRGAGAKAPAAD